MSWSFSSRPFSTRSRPPVFPLENLERDEATRERWSAGPVMAKRMAKVGARAPDFALSCTDGPGTERREVSLDDFADRWLILVFYSRDFSLL
jgi:AhpC/TSA family